MVAHLEENVAVLELFQKMLIHQVIHKHLERSDLDQRPVCEAGRRLPVAPNCSNRLAAHHEGDVAVLELFWGITTPWSEAERSPEINQHIHRPFHHKDVRRPLYQSRKIPSLGNVFRMTVLELDIFATIANLNAGKNYFSTPPFSAPS